MNRCVSMMALAALAASAACGDDNKSAAAPAPDAAIDAAPAGPLVQTTAGPVRGSATATMQSFLGLPYAAPPVGDLRWKAPVAPATFTAERDATKLAPHCAQGASPFGAMSSSEDCLYLNVYTPTTAGPHPVMFWIHGGALLVGESDEYDATPLVAQGITVVTINYRLGILGFMSHPALTAEQGGSSGNYGLMDQQFALHWVQDNIARFGGEPTNVTIFGESAGGLSVHAQLVIPGADGLFKQAIAESGAYGNALLPTLKTAETTGAGLATAAGCPATCDAAALRALPVDKILTAEAAISSWIPAIDGKVFTRSITESYAAGGYLHVPILEGSNHDEYRLFARLDEITPPDGKILMTQDDYAAAIASVFGTTTDGMPSATSLAILQAYPLTAYDNNPTLAFATAGTDQIFACNSRATGAALSASTTSKVFVYEFNDQNAPELFLPGRDGFSFGAAHASEIQYLFVLPRSTLAADSKALSDVMVKYWTNFAKLGDPNGTDLPAWPAYATTGTTMDSILSLTPGAGKVAVTTMFAVDHKCRP